MGEISAERMDYIRRATADGAVSVNMQKSLLDEIDRLQAELARSKRGGHTLGQIVEAQCRDALNATGLHHLIDATGDGDWGAVWESAAELGDRARRAEAALSRVTDDSMAERIRDELAHTTIGSGYYQTSVGTDEAAEMADWVVAAIRAVAAGEQAEGDDR